MDANHSKVNQSQSRGGERKTEKEHHYEMTTSLSKKLTQDVEPHWGMFKNMMRPYLDNTELLACKNIMEICERLLMKGVIRLGEYNTLLTVFKHIEYEPCVEIVERFSKEMKVIKEQTHLTLCQRQQDIHQDVAEQPKEKDAQRQISNDDTGSLNVVEQPKEKDVQRQISTDDTNSLKVEQPKKKDAQRQISTDDTTSLKKKVAQKQISTDTTSLKVTKFPETEKPNEDTLVFSGELQQVTTAMSDLTTDVTTVSNDVQQVTDTTDIIKEDVTSMADNVHEIRDKVHQVSKQIHQVSEDVHQVRDKMIRRQGKGDILAQQKEALGIEVDQPKEKHAQRQISTNATLLDQARLMDKTMMYMCLFKLMFVVGKQILDTYLSLQLCESSLSTFLNNNKHKLFHLLNGRKPCCICSNDNKGRSFNISSKWEKLFTQSDSICQTSVYCICKYTARRDIVVEDLDITLLVHILINCVKMPASVKECVKKIRYYRNRFSHSTEHELDEQRFQEYWYTMESCILLIANKCSPKENKSFRRKISACLTSYFIRTHGFQEKELLLYEQMQKIAETERTIKSCNETIKKLSARKENACYLAMTTSEMQTIKDLKDTRWTRQRLESLLPDLYENLNPDFIIMEMYYRKMISKNEVTRIFSNKRRRDRAEKLLLIIMDSDDCMLQMFLKVLHDTQEEETLEKLMTTEPPNFDIRIINGMPFTDYAGNGRNNAQIRLEFHGRNGESQNARMHTYFQTNSSDIDDLIQQFSGMTLHDFSKGSVIMHLRLQNEGDILDCLQKKFIDGSLRKMITSILLQSGIQDQAQVHVSINFENRHAQSSMKDKSFFDRNLECLLEELSPKPVAAALFKKDVIDRDEACLIFSDQHWDRKSQVHQLIAIMKTKEGGVDHFIYALRNTCQGRIESTLSYKVGTATLKQSEKKSHQPKTAYNSEQTSKPFSEGVTAVTSGEFQMPQSSQQSMTCHRSTSDSPQNETGDALGISRLSESGEDDIF